ncbi:hypothetical protein [Dactylosporangium sp. CA-233914]|uniref:hypothetical protein n=1 Tax=Dactylosporangium sp. CA-233914 TaxID=3239934 RepID=UPI003D8AED95
MVDVSVEQSGDDPAVMRVKLQAPSWEFNFRAHLSQLGQLRSIRQADWTSRRSLQIGDVAGVPVHWCINKDDTATALIGSDDEAWDIAFVIPVDTIDRLVVEAADFLPPPDPPAVLPGTAGDLLIELPSPRQRDGTAEWRKLPAADPET